MKSSFLFSRLCSPLPILADFCGLCVLVRHEERDSIFGVKNLFSSHRRTLPHFLRIFSSLVPQAEWEERFNELMEWKRVNGTCSVPQRIGGNGGLGQWLSTQRWLSESTHEYFLCIILDLSYHTSALISAVAFTQRLLRENHCQLYALYII